MYFDPYLAQRMAEERIKDRLAARGRGGPTDPDCQKPQEGTGMVAVAGADAQQSGGPRCSTAELMGRSGTLVHPRVNHQMADGRKCVEKTD